MSDKISDERLAELIDEHGGYETNSYVMPSTLRMGELESALRELVGARAEIERLAGAEHLANIVELPEGTARRGQDVVTRESARMAINTIRALDARLKEAERDAKRYRFLRDEEYPEPLLLMLRTAGIPLSRVDAAVDDAIAAQEDKT